MTTIDWAKLAQTAEDATKLIDDGVYTVECTKAESVRAASSGAPMIKLTLRISEGPNTGRNLWTNFVLSEDSGFALKRLFGNLEAFGLTMNWLNQGPSFEMVAAALVGRFARVQVGNRVWQGQPRNEVTGVLVAAPGTIQPNLPDPGDVLLDRADQLTGTTDIQAASGNIAF